MENYQERNFREFEYSRRSWEDVPYDYYGPVSSREIWADKEEDQAREDEYLRERLDDDLDRLHDQEEAAMEAIVRGLHGWLGDEQRMRQNPDLVVAYQ